MANQEFKGTKGNWTIREHPQDKNDFRVLVEGGNSHIAIARCNDWRNDNNKANAQLIAAAPELLKVLQFVEATLSEGHKIRRGGTSHSKIMGAINKALGK